MDIESSGLMRIDLPAFELVKGLESELVIVEESVYRQMDSICKDKLDKMEVVFLFRNSQSPIDYYVSNIVVEIGEDTPRSLLENQLQYFENQIRRSAILKSRFLSLNQELILAMGNMQQQLDRVKKSYQEKMPKRLENFRGLTAMSKYVAGEDSGGEFFDLFTDDNNVFILMSSCSSYLASSSLLKFFSEMKSLDHVTKEAVEEFIHKIDKEVNELNKQRKNPIKVELLTGILNSSTLHFEGFKFGDFQLLSSDLEKKIETENQSLANPSQSFFEMNFAREERIIINSPGFQKNWNTVKANFLLEELIGDKNLRSIDLLDEVYFKLKSKSLDGFLAFDASSIIFEVNHNVILKV